MNFRDDLQPLPPVEIPCKALSEQALQGVIDDFVLREGTDYGHREVTHEEKTRQVQRQIDRGEVKILYDPNTDSITLVTV